MTPSFWEGVFIWGRSMGLPTCRAGFPLTYPAHPPHKGRGLSSGIITPPDRPRKLEARLSSGIITPPDSRAQVAFDVAYRAHPDRREKGRKGPHKDIRKRPLLRSLWPCTAAIRIGGGASDAPRSGGPKPYIGPPPTAPLHRHS